MSRSSISSSNSILLSWRGWVAVAVILVGMLHLIPMLWPSLEGFNPSPDYRLPYSLSDDYWKFRRWSGYARSNFSVLVIGDSVIWGHYVPMDGTLSHFLNELTGGETFANLGVDGLHPAAMVGLLKYYGRSIRNSNVILHLNPLWMTSRRHDLSGEEEFRFNHPRLIPQFIPRIACYRAPIGQRLGAVLERYVPFLTWSRHLRMVYFENIDIGSWSMQHPYSNPLKAITLKLPAPGENPPSRPVPWFKRGMRKQDFPWVDVTESFQWRSFLKLIDILERRGNRVFVLIGPFNPYILTKGSLRRYDEVKKEMEKQLRKRDMDFLSFSNLPSEYYADASHPLKEGYRRMAEEMLDAESFRKWLNNDR